MTKEGLTPKAVIDQATSQGVKMVDLRFVDLPGTWQHTSVPLHRLSEESFAEGFGFDGSSVRGFQTIEASDMVILPDPTTAQLDPFTQERTLVLICDVVDPLSGERYERDPRYIAEKAEKNLLKLGLADTAFFGPEAEFFVFDDVRYDSAPNGAFFEVDSVEAAWNTGRDEMPNLGYKVRSKGGYFPCMPQDTLMDIRTEMVQELEALGISVEVSHHEVATAGQCEIDMRYDSLRRMADKLMWFKYVVRNVARRNGKSATFMPKPIYGDNGSGMHCHQSLWKNGVPLFAGDQHAGVSKMALHYIGGILKHAQALCAFSNATTNSYRRLVPGYEAPVNLAYSSRNRSASIRIPVYQKGEASKRIEVRFPDSSGNGYLTFAAMVQAGLDGIRNEIDPGDPLDRDLYSLSAEELAKVPTVPGSLSESLVALEADHEFLLEGGVFTPSVISKWIEYKREAEIDPVRLRPVPHEFELYYDI